MCFDRMDQSISELQTYCCLAAKFFFITSFLNLLIALIESEVNKRIKTIDSPSNIQQVYKTLYSELLLFGA